MVHAICEEKMKLIISKEILEDLYTEKKFSCPKIAILYKCTGNQVYYKLKKFGIKTRNPSECQSGELNHYFGKQIPEHVKKSISLSLTGEKNPFFGMHHSKKSKQQIRDSNYHTNIEGKNNPFYGKKHKLESREKISLSNGGSGNLEVGWNDYPLEFNDILRNKIRKRDNACQGRSCSMTRGLHFTVYKRNLEIHHVDYNKHNCEESNLITLCKRCNIQANKDKIFWQKYYMEKVKEIYLDMLIDLHECNHYRKIY